MVTLVGSSSCRSLDSGVCFVTTGHNGAIAYEFPEPMDASADARSGVTSRLQVPSRQGELEIVELAYVSVSLPARQEPIDAEVLAWDEANDAGHWYLGPPSHVTVRGTDRMPDGGLGDFDGGVNIPVGDGGPYEAVFASLPSKQTFAITLWSDAVSLTRGDQRRPISFSGIVKKSFGPGERARVSLADFVSSSEVSVERVTPGSPACGEVSLELSLDTDEQFLLYGQNLPDGVTKLRMWVPDGERSSFSLYASIQNGGRSDTFDSRVESSLPRIDVGQLRAGQTISIRSSRIEVPSHNITTDAGLIGDPSSVWFMRNGQPYSLGKGCASSIRAIGSTIALTYKPPIAADVLSGTYEVNVEYVEAGITKVTTYSVIVP